MTKPTSASPSAARRSGQQRPARSPLRRRPRITCQALAWLSLGAVSVANAEPSSPRGNDDSSDLAAERMVEVPGILPANPVAHQANAAQPSSPGKRSLALVISGAVSLGAYEAGVLYYLTEALKTDGAPFDLELAAGASAGSANALIALLSECAPKVDSPENSLFWQVWVPPGINELYVPQAGGGRGVLSRRFLESSWRAIDATLTRGLDASCDRVLGVTATRAEPIRVPLSRRGLDVPRMSEKFIVRIQGNGRGVRPTITNYVDAGSPSVPLLLATGAGGDVRSDAIRDALFASAAFPLAFEPQRVPHCLAEREGHLACDPATRNDEFVDGGLLDNQPLRLAVDAAYEGLDASGRWSETPTGGTGADVEFVYVTPAATVYPTELQETSTSDAWVTLAGSLGRGVIETARSRELLALAESRPEIRDSLDTIESYYPKAGELFGAFLGFFDEGFRKYDFYLGMYDAHRFLQRRFPKWSAPETMVAERSNAGWSDFECVRATLSDSRDRQLRCAGDARQGMRILLQVSLDRVYARCEANPAPLSASHRHCELARRGGKPPRVVPLPEDVDVHSYRAEPEESAEQHLFRLLAGYEYPFADLGLSPTEADEVPSRVRGMLLEILDDFASRQHSSRDMLEIAGRYAIDSFHYSPPRHLAYAVLGSAVEAAYGYAPRGDLNFARWMVGASIYGAAELMSSRDDLLGVGPFAGIELQPTRFNTATVQWRGGLRAGYLLSSRDDFDGEACSEKRMPCSGLALGGYVAVSVAQMARLQLGWVWSDPTRRASEQFWAIVPGIGLQWTDD